MEPSYVFCEKLISGRMSFQGMNPAIEKHMESIRNQNEERLKEEESQQKDVSDEQMSVQWQKIRGKFEAMNKLKNLHYNENKNDEPTQKKPRFLKPID